MAETSSVEPETETYKVERRSEYTFLQPNLWDYRLSFNQDSSNTDGDAYVVAVRINNTTISDDEFPVELDRQAAIDMAKAILAEAGETFADYELENFQNRRSAI